MASLSRLTSGTRPLTLALGGAWATWTLTDGLNALGSSAAISLNPPVIVYPSASAAILAVVAWAGLVLAGSHILDVLYDIGQKLGGAESAA